MSEPADDFAAMFEASIQAKRIEKGQTIEGTIVAIGPEVALVDVGGKSEATIDVGELPVDLVRDAGAGRPAEEPLDAPVQPLRMALGSAEKRLLEDRLKQLKGGIEAEREKSSTGRRPYPTVVPKFRNPDRPSETWAGRGKTPRWLAAKLKSGKRIDDFRIREVA